MSDTERPSKPPAASPENPVNAWEVPGDTNDAEALGPPPDSELSELEDVLGPFDGESHGERTGVTHAPEAPVEAPEEEILQESGLQALDSLDAEPQLVEEEEPISLEESPLDDDATRFAPAQVAEPEPPPRRLAPPPLTAPRAAQGAPMPPPLAAPRRDSRAGLPVDEPPTMLNDNGLFRQEAQKLARARDWQRLAAITSAAVDGASWAALPETKATLLLDLARVYRDRLRDAGSAEDTFRRLAQLEPGHPDAIDFLSEHYRGRGDWRALYDLYAAAIEPTWDPNLRLEWTREMVAIAGDQLASADLAIEAWERLWRLGDAVEETARALSEVYRRHGRWERLAAFLEKRAASLSGSERIVALREIAEAYLSGLRDQDRAARVLEQILAERPGDPIALLALARVLARRQDWEALADLGARPLEGMPPQVILDFRRLVADALWSAGDLERAVIAHERVLEIDPEDGDALKAKEEYLARTGRSEALVNFLALRADRAAGDGERGQLLARAAELAEKQLDDPRLAVSLWERRATIESGRLEALQALTPLYESLADLGGVARCLEGQLALTRHPGSRVELLRRLGDHYANRMGDDGRAEACWKEITAIVPEDRATRDELSALHRRRGNFEALDASLTEQGWRAVDDSTILHFFRAAAANLDENLADPGRSVRAWLRVIDLAPGDGAALSALIGHYRRLDRRRELIAALEGELRATTDGVARLGRGLEIARLWEEEGDRLAALAAYERLLAWSPTDGDALAALARLRVGNERSAFEVAAASDGTAEERRTRLRAALGLLDPADKLGRFYGLRRLLWLSGHDPAVLHEVAAAAAEAGAWVDLAAVYLEVAGQAPDGEARTAYLRELASIYEDKLHDPVRAFLVLQAIGRQPIDDAQALATLTRLAQATSRHEDLLALLDGSARAGAPEEARKRALRQRAAICEGQLGDPERAFREQVRLLELDPHDREALAEARRLAEAKQLWRALDALYAELADRAATVAERVALIGERQRLHADHLGDPTGALDQLLCIYRLTPAALGLGEQLLAIAAAQNAWDRVLPLLEARTRALGESASPDELARLAALHEDKRGDRQRAFELYAEAFVLRPSWGELAESLDRLAAATGRHDLLAWTYRQAAARAGDPTRMLDLYGRVTRLYGEALRSPDDALDMHRRILQLQPASPASLDVVIAHARETGQARDLRDRLQQWIDHAPGDDTAARVPRWLEIARLSRERLGDAETALATFAQVLEIDPTNEEASAGVRSLTEGVIDPALEMRRLRIELRRATPERRVEIHLELARIQEQQLDDLDGAIATLRALIQETTADGPGYGPLARLLRAKKSWSELIDLIEARAAALVDPEARISALESAVAECDEHPTAATTPRRERLFRQLLEARPTDVALRRRLLSLYRGEGRFPELAELLRASCAALPPKDEERARYEAELARILDRALGRLDEAEALLQARAKRTPDDDDLLLHLASIRLRRSDFAGWLALREQHGKRQPRELGAFILCHLAEACDETAGQQAKVPGYYREARALDAANPAAMEALKAIGRRAKTWRATAALLPDADEASLPWRERAARLKARGDAARGREPQAALGWYLRAVAVDPDHDPAWDALATLRQEQGDTDGALEAVRSSLAAFERSTGPEPGRLRDHAERIQSLAVALERAGDEAGAALAARRAYELVPAYAAAALAVADQQLKAGEPDEAFSIYDRVLRDAARPGAPPLGNSERLHALFQRGALAAARGQSDQAITDLREALRIEPLHPGVLNALADVLAAKGRVAAAIQHSIQALLVVHEPARRGRLLARLGRLWEDRLGGVDEAGVCYDLALSVGYEEDPEIMVRALRHYRQAGRTDRALEVIEKLLPATTEPRELAALWTERGSILAQSDEERAMEAFDMALSYDPGAAAALTGLSQILEHRGDWEQLLQIHESRAETGVGEERAEALRALSRIALGHLHDAARAERYLREVVELQPTRGDWETLLEIYGDNPQKAKARRAAVAGLLGLAGPWMHRLIELGRQLATTGERKWAWCLLSPLMSSTMPDPQLKAMVLELRKEYEKSDNSAALSPTLHATIRHPDVPAPLVEALASLPSIGRATPEQMGLTGVSKLDERTAVGKTFAGIAARLGCEGAVLYRVAELGEPFAVLDAPNPSVVVKAELLQLLSVAETNFLFASMLELTRPGVRAVMGLAADERPRMVPALVQAVGLAEPRPELEALAARLAGLLGPERLAALREPLGEAAPTAGRAFAGLLDTARRVGLIAAADLRFVARLLTRLDETLPKMPTVGKIEDLDEFIGGAPPVRSLISFAASDAFGKAIAG